jgi:hypothetical protein
LEVQRDALLVEGAKILNTIKVTIDTARVNGSVGANGHQITKAIQAISNGFLIADRDEPRMGYNQLSKNQYFAIDCLTAFGYKKPDATKMIIKASIITR